MTKEFILDIGIGCGGEYINQLSQNNRQRVGIDIQAKPLFTLRQNHAEVLPVLTNAKRLPFGDNTFNQLEFVLPNTKLVAPGLLTDHFAMLEKYRKKFAITHPNGWYPEFSRVLISGGKLIITGDLWVHPQQVKATSHAFFTVHHTQQITLDKFTSLRTNTTKFLQQKVGVYVEELNKPWEDTLVEITLQNIK